MGCGLQPTADSPQRTADGSEPVPLEHLHHRRERPNPFAHGVDGDTALEVDVPLDVGIAVPVEIGPTEPLLLVPFVDLAVAL